MKTHFSRCSFSLNSQSEVVAQSHTLKPAAVFNDTVWSRSLLQHSSFVCLSSCMIHDLMMTSRLILKSDNVSSLNTVVHMLPVCPSPVHPLFTSCSSASCEEKEGFQSAGGRAGPGRAGPGQQSSQLVCWWFWSRNNINNHPQVLICELPVSRSNTTTTEPHNVVLPTSVQSSV